MAKAEKNPKVSETTPTGIFTLTEDSVTLSVTLPRQMMVPLLKEVGAEATIDLGELASKPKAVTRVTVYGIGRFLRDGCTPGKFVSDEGTFYKERGDAPEGVKVREATPEERRVEACALSAAKWQALLTDTLRSRVGGSVDPMLQECRILTVKALVKRDVARKAIPKLDSLRVMEDQCKPFDGLWTRIVSAAQRVVAARQVEDI